MIASGSGNVSEGLHPSEQVRWGARKGLRMLFLMLLVAVVLMRLGGASGRLGVLKQNGARFAEQHAQLL
ncbi:hypothetical protein [Terriglobus albidus]|uniref:hypothetical protein n=1 Tax=Terriglobus albidus TaxID=1592106 RepID=UPI0021E08451|nr:hypothetical protein [Terriglobus albidus]